MRGKLKFRRAREMATTIVIALSAVACGLTDSGSSNDGDGIAQGVGAAFVQTGTTTVILINTDGDRFVEFETATGEFSKSRPIDELADGFPFDRVMAASEYSEVTPNRPMVVDGSGGRGSVQEAGEDTYADDELLSVLTPGLPFEEVGAIVTISGNMIVFDSSGEEYAVYITASDSYTGIFDFTETGLLGAEATITEVGACFLSPVTGTDLYMFDATGRRFSIYDTTTTSFATHRSLTFLGDGSLDFNNDEDPNF